MLEVGFGGRFEFGDDALGEGFAEFDAPLVEGVDIPEDALGKDTHFVEGDEASEGGGGAFGFDFGEGFSEGKALGLRKDIGDH